MIDSAAVELSRLQFGLTAMYHFLFVPLTLGLSLLLGIMETVYVMTVLVFLLAVLIYTSIALRVMRGRVHLADVERRSRRY